MLSVAIGSQSAAALIAQEGSAEPEWVTETDARGARRTAGNPERMASMGQFDTAPGPDTNAPDPAPTITAADQQAKDFIESFRALVAAKLPKLDLPHPLTARLARRARNVPPEFAKTVASMVALSPDLQAVKQYDVDQNKADQQQIEAYMTVEQELSTVVKGVRFLIAMKRSKTNVAGFQMQAFAQALSKDPAFAHLLPALEAIKEARRPKRAKAASPQQPQSGSPQNQGPLVTH